jgi:hypothetical protein
VRFLEEIIESNLNILEKNLNKIAENSRGKGINHRIINEVYTFWRIFEDIG